MRTEVVVTLIGVGLLCGALAMYLALIGYHLAKVNAILDKVIGGVETIAEQTQPVAFVVGSLAKDVTAIDDALKGLVALATGGPASAEPAFPSQDVRRGRVRASR